MPKIHWKNLRLSFLFSFYFMGAFIHLPSTLHSVNSSTPHLIAQARMLERSHFPSSSLLLCSNLALGFLLSREPLCTHIWAWTSFIALIVDSLQLTFPHSLFSLPLLTPTMLSKWHSKCKSFFSHFKDKFNFPFKWSSSKLVLFLFSAFSKALLYSLPSHHFLLLLESWCHLLCILIHLEHWKFPLLCLPPS